MKRMFIIANWKSNKTELEANKWLQEYQISEDKEVIICPPFTLLSTLKSSIVNHQSSIRLGAQDISPFEKGPYTGEVNGKQIKEFADYVIIGHSERRKNFLENDDMLSKKVEMAKKYNLMPIFCVQDENTFIPEGVEIVVYEPVFAIGTGNPDTSENAENIAKKVKDKKDINYILYGGSVTSKNVKIFTQMPNINGVLVGGASLDPLEFLEIVKNA